MKIIKFWMAVEDSKVTSKGYSFNGQPSGSYLISHNQYNSIDLGDVVLSLPTYDSNNNLITDAVME